MVIHSLPKKQKVLVTGAAGFIAFHTIEALLRKGVPVFGVDNFDPFYDLAIKENNLNDLHQIAAETGTSFEFKKMDLLEIEPTSFEGVQFSHVVHLAAKAGVRPSLIDPEGYLRANVVGTLKMLEFARHRGIRNFVFASSSSVYGDDTPVPFSEDAKADQPVSPYAASKRACELYCSNYAHLYKLKIASLRFFTVYGPRQRPDLAIHKFAKLILSGQPITLYGDGTTERDYTFVSDTVSGVLGAIQWVERQPESSYQVFNLGGSGTTSLKRLVELLEKELGTRAIIRWEGAQPGDVERTCADIARATAELGYRPQLAIEEGIRRFAAWITQAGVEKRRAA